MRVEEDGILDFRSENELFTDRKSGTQMAGKVLLGNYETRGVSS